jgi:ATP-binding cassette subfamily B protein
MSDDRDLVPRATAGRRIRFALALLKGLRPSLIAAIAAMTVVLAVAGAALSLAFRAMVDGAIDSSWAYATGAAVVAGLAAGAMSVGYRVNFNVQTLAASRLSAEVERRALRLSARMRGIEHLERPEYLDQIQLVSQGSQGLIWALLAVAELASVTASLAISVVLLFTVSPWLALIPVFAIPAVLLSPLAQRLSEQAMAAAAERSRASDSIHRLFSDRNAAMEMRIFGCGAALDERANQLWDEVGSVKFRGALHSAVVSTVGWVCLAIGYIGALAVVVDMVSSGAATPGDALLVTQLTLLIRTDIARSAASIRQSASAMRMIDRVVWLEDTAERDEREFAGTGTAPRPIRSGIAVENVSFRYPGTDVTVLDGIELDLPAGSSLAIVGRNGSGKTTLAKLLCRLYDPDEGSISVDGRDMRDLDPEDWRATIGGSFQDYLQLEEILRRSVGAGDPDLMDDEPAVAAAVDRAGATRVLSDLTDGMTTHLGQSYRDGAQLSGGQWQRLAIARGMMRTSPSMLVLDEPTAALDPTAERQLLERYFEATDLGDGTRPIVVIITHRMSSVRSADQIVVLDEGRVVETGSHDDLIERRGRYFDMFQRQAAAYED